ncbi:hypothetical protein DAPPUDRAFT_123298 [Daphnia pulex]|uniref:Glutathione S-transferase mu2 isoform b n=1 Tax=Daphnia pulex TaxID=6669 RepID=E9I5P0_DAPPU|nr:hypothetical protein DAPPUDRAFT_123298 [Daphnia pulex]QNM80607.1 glutathione S-transferase mu2 isoform b [Daphnia pulex]|eukprot:EFX60690.1 hypothetical protein DAPPUDRAFT_123298 [Daphnia pulex]
MAVKTGYWNIRGAYEEKRYNVGPAPDYDPSEWLNNKFNLGLDFPNCPYYIDGDVKLSQTFAILKYLGRKHNMAAKTEEEQIRVDLIEAEAIDVGNERHPQRPTTRSGRTTRIPAHLREFDLRGPR